MERVGTISRNKTGVETLISHSVMMVTAKVKHSRHQKYCYFWVEKMCEISAVRREGASRIRNAWVSHEMRETWQDCHWLGLVLYVPFSALTLLFGWQEGYPAHKKTRTANTQRFSSGTGGEGGPEGNRLTQVHLESRPLNRSCGDGGGSGDGGASSGRSSRNWRMRVLHCVSTEPSCTAW